MTYCMEYTHSICAIAHTLCCPYFIAFMLLGILNCMYYVVVTVSIYCIVRTAGIVLDMIDCL